MAKKLGNIRVAIIIAEGFEQVEMTEPQKALEEAGARTEIISLKLGKIKGWKSSQWGDEFTIDKSIDEANPEDYNALLIPGGVMSPDKLRMNDKVVKFVNTIFFSGKPIAAICHGPWLLVEADVVKNKQVTSYPSLKTDLTNAGANWIDRSVVVDNGLITSRRRDDLPEFNQKMLEEFAEGVHSHKD